MSLQPNTWNAGIVNPTTYTATPDVPSTWLINPQGTIDTWDNPNRTWDSTYSWDGTTSQVTELVPSTWSEI